MVQSSAKTVTAYLKSLPADRRREVAAVRDVVLANLPAGYAETMNWGMISYEVPLATYPDTYNGKPLMFGALAAQKNYNALYLSCVYQDEAQLAKLLAAFEKLGRKPNMGKSCIRFKRADELPLVVIGRLIKALTVKKFIKGYEAARAGR